MINSSQKHAKGFSNTQQVSTKCYLYSVFCNLPINHFLQFRNTDKRTNHHCQNIA